MGHRDDAEHGDLDSAKRLLDALSKEQLSDYTRELTEFAEALLSAGQTPEVRR
ncbi:MAG: hypothetical protein HYV63_11355 [Candidatus Schekmanbacteria bacterium]|nr:hypothetical protein [Candidatus Schekmanbacteria bacterium]